jgi:hypothetical protein
MLSHRCSRGKMDVSRRNRLVEKLKVKQTEVGQNPGPTVSLEDFFEGNDDWGSIGVQSFRASRRRCPLPTSGSYRVVARIARCGLESFNLNS